MEPIRIDGKFTGYSISQIGLVYNEFTKKFLKGSIKSDGYHRVGLTIDGKTIKFYIHRLVASAFLDNPNNLPQVNHIDNNKSNNYVTNLEWTTQQLNIEHKVKQNRQAKGANCHSTKLKDSQVSRIRIEYSLGGVSMRQLAIKYSVDKKLIWSILNRKIWKHI